MKQPSWTVMNIVPIHGALRPKLMPKKPPALAMKNPLRSHPCKRTFEVDGALGKKAIVIRSNKPSKEETRRFTTNSL
jgi:hypothetical protein